MSATGETGLRRHLYVNEQRRSQVLGLVGLGTSTWKDWHAETGGTAGHGTWAVGLVGLNTSDQRDWRICAVCVLKGQSASNWRRGHGHQVCRSGWQQLEGSGCVWVCKRSKCQQLERPGCVYISSVNLILCVYTYNSLANFKLN